MAETKLKRSKKKQMGQFMTPIEKCEEILKNYTFSIKDKVLEPSFGNGNFIITLIKKFLPLYEGDIKNKLDLILSNNIYGVELDKDELTDLEKIECEKKFIDNKETLTNLLNHHQITTAEYERRLSDVQDIYYECLKEGASN